MSYGLREDWPNLDPCLGPWAVSTYTEKGSRKQVNILVPPPAPSHFLTVDLM